MLRKACKTYLADRVQKYAGQYVYGRSCKVIKIDVNVTQKITAISYFPRLIACAISVYQAFWVQGEDSSSKSSDVEASPGAFPLSASATAQDKHVRSTGIVTQNPHPSQMCIVEVLSRHESRATALFPGPSQCFSVAC